MLGIPHELDQAIERRRYDDLTQRKFHAEGLQIVLQRHQLFAARHFMDAIHDRRLFRFERFGRCDISRDHEVLDKPVGIEPLTHGHAHDATCLIEHDTAFRQIKGKWFARVAGLGQQRPGRPEVLQMFGCVARVDTRLSILIGNVRCHPDHSAREAPAGNLPVRFDLHMAGERCAVLPFLQRTHVRRQLLGQHRDDAVRKIDAVATRLCLTVEVRTRPHIE